MLIQFYNIPAISVSNEPYFASESDRITKMSQYRVYSTVFAYYPPMYKNRIKFDTSFLSLSHTFNYLSITANNKTWYYFVDSIDYCNEKIYYINIVMDTVQTFYFDINFKRFEKSRKLTYSGIRDNISLDPTLYPYSLRDLDVGKPYVIVVQYNTRLAFTTCKNLTNGAPVDNPIGWENFENNKIYTDDGTCYTDGLKTMYILMPVENSDHISFYDKDMVATTYPYGYSRQEDIILVLNTLANDPNVVNIFISKSLPRGITYGSYTFNGYNYHGFLLDTTCQIFTNYLIKTGNNTTLGDGSIVHYAEWKQCGNFTTPSRATCDTNYTQICIGELNDYVPVPIELLEPETSYDIYYMYDVCSGARTYKVDADALEAIKFRHICNSIENMQTFNDYYNTYLLQNKGTLTTGVALQKTQAWVNFANQVLNQNAAKSFAAGTTGGTAGAIVAGVEGNITSGVDIFNAIYGINKSVQAQRENAYYTPDTIKTGNNFTNDIINGFINKIILITRVGDYDEIEHIREYTGYLCHDTTYGQTLSSLIVTSGAVNDKYLIMGDCELYLTTFNTANHIADLKNRFKSGVRFYINMSDIGE